MRINKKNDRSPSLRSRIFGAFAIFSLIVICILWLFQFVLLDDIYRAVKIGDLYNCADEVADGIARVSDTDDGYADRIRAATDSSAKKYTVCISIYEITRTGMGKRGELLTETHLNSFCFIHNIRSEDLVNNLYGKAKNAGGEYSEEIALSAVFGGELEAGENVIHVKLVEKDGRELLIMLNSELMPLDSTVGTLRLQLVIISLILIIVGFILSAVLSSRISKPIREMSNEASKLALGNYNVNFDGGNCEETVNLSEALNRAAYELGELDRMQKDLIANVSHDLRTPLTMIAGYTEAMRDLPGEATPENMQIVIDETERLTSLVSDMLEVSKYQNGSQIINPSRFNLTETVRVTIERYAKLMERDGYDISFHADSDIYVYADERRILQVIYNLISNAVNYTGDDKKVVIAQRIATRRDGDFVTLEVSDSGAGISKENLPLVWERYYKAHDFHKRANMGTGLGLSIVKNILILHGAEFGVRSALGEGSTFWFTLRVADFDK